MGAILGTILAFGIVFGVLVFVHEFGHFFIAKSLGINVEVFSWGYGKRLFGIKKGGTDYRISVFPLGGFVKFSGEEVYEKKRELKPGDFMAAKRWQRFLVLVMGSVMNIILAVVLMAFINMVGVNVPEYLNQAPVIGWIEEGSPAASANLQIDDEILNIDNKRTETWNDVLVAVGTKPKREIMLQVKRGEEVLDVELTTVSRTRYEMGYAGFFGKILTEIRMVLPGSPAEKAGIKPGDVILAVDDEPVFYFQFGEIMQANPEKELEFTIDREGEILQIPVTLRRKGDVGEVGVFHEPKSVMEKYAFFPAIWESVERNKKLTFLVIEFIKDLFTGEASTRQLAGPIEIANVSYTAFRQGFIAMMSWIALISLQLGIINLFPIPVLDGGQILVLSLEGLARRDFNAKVKQIVMQIGFAMFIFLIAFAVLNDVVKRLPNGWESLLPW